MGSLRITMAPLIYTLYGFAIFFFASWCFVWLIHITAIVYGKWRLHRTVPSIPRETPLAGVSILKPLVGVDANLCINLETFFTQNYPLFEIMFCIQDENDPSLMLVNKLIEKYPNVDAQIFIGGTKVGLNPKINNMMPGYDAAKYELILISDSGLRMKEDTLLDMVAAMTDDVGLVHQMPFCCDRNSFPSVLEKVYFGTAHARIYLAADFLGINCATGMSELIRKKLLDEVGGLKAFSHYIAEDFFFAKSVQDRGWRIRINSQPGWQNSGICQISNFQNRLIRWSKLRFAMVPHTIILEPLSECMVLGILCSCCVNFLFNWNCIVFCLVHILVWFLLDYILLCIVQNGPLPFSKFEYVVSWVFRESSSFYLYLKAVLNPTIKWRTGEYRLRWGGIAEEMKPKS